MRWKTSSSEKGEVLSGRREQVVKALGCEVLGASNGPSGLALLEWERVEGWRGSQGCRVRGWSDRMLPFEYDVDPNGGAVTGR